LPAGLHEEVIVYAAQAVRTVLWFALACMCTALIVAIFTSNKSYRSEKKKEEAAKKDAEKALPNGETEAENTPVEPVSEKAVEDGVVKQEV